MDILKQFTIPYKGLSAGNHHFEFDVDDRFFDAFGGELVTAGRAKVEVDALKAAAGLTLDFSIRGEAQVPCDRCLEPLTLPVEYEGELAVRAADPEKAGECDGEVMWVAQQDDRIDLAQYIYESICLSLPMTRVHGTDAAGVSLCDPDMTARFRIISQSEFDEMEHRSGTKNPLQDELGRIKEEMDK